MVHGEREPVGDGGVDCRCTSSVLQLGPEGVQQVMRGRTVRETASRLLVAWPPLFFAAIGMFCSSSAESSLWAEPAPQGFRRVFRGASTHAKTGPETMEVPPALA